MWLASSRRKSRSSLNSSASQHLKLAGLKTAVKFFLERGSGSKLRRMHRSWQLENWERMIKTNIRYFDWPSLCTSSPFFFFTRRICLKDDILWLQFFIHKNPSMLPPGLILRLSSYDLFGLFSHRSVNFHSKKAHLQNFPHSNFSLPTRFITIQLKAIPFKTGVMKQLTLYTLVKFFVTFILREKRIASTIRKMMLREDWINNMTTYVEQADTQNQYTQPYQRTLMV